MELFVNDLSIAGQFPDIPTFCDAVDRVMKMRNIARQFGRELYCHRNIVGAQVTRDHKIQQAIQHFNRNQQRAVMQWLTQQGPFWEDVRDHSSNDWLQCDEDLVTDAALGEAAYCCLHGTDRRLVSLTPSSWEFTPIHVVWKSGTGADRPVQVHNYWTQETLEVALRDAPVPIASWQQLQIVCTARCPHLTFVEDSFEPLQGTPFVSCAADRIVVLLDTLHRLKQSFDEQGHRTAEGQRIYQDHFTGEKSWFSDSSLTEKNDFEKELTFRHPEGDPDLFCTWHGKVKTPQIRIHFSWPVQAETPLYVVYIGPKITRR